MTTKFVTIALLVAAVAATMVPQSTSAPSPVDCGTVVLSMSDCLSYVTNGSTVNKPEGNCCSGLKSVLKTNAECLCEGFKSSSQFGVVLNNTKALSLPDACHVHAPSKDLCGLSISPTGAPSQSPAAGAGGAAVSPAGAPSASSTANAPSGGIEGSAMSPAMTPGSTSSSNIVGIPVQLMIVVGLATAFFSRF